MHKNEITRIKRKCMAAHDRYKRRWNPAHKNSEDCALRCSVAGKRRWRAYSHMRTFLRLKALL